MTDSEKQARTALRALRKAVVRTLTVKRRLGQYAVMGKDGKAVRVPPGKLPLDEKG